MLQAKARDVQFQDHAVVHQVVDRRCRRHRVFEDVLPLRKRLVRTQENTQLLVAVRYQSEENFHLLPALLNVAKIVDVSCSSRKWNFR